MGPFFTIWLRKNWKRSSKELHNKAELNRNTVKEEVFELIEVDRQSWGET